MFACVRRDELLQALSTKDLGSGTRAIETHLVGVATSLRKATPRMALRLVDMVGLCVPNMVQTRLVAVGLNRRGTASATGGAVREKAQVDATEPGIEGEREGRWSGRVKTSDRKRAEWASIIKLHPKRRTRATMAWDAHMGMRASAASGTASNMLSRLPHDSERPAQSVVYKHTGIPRPRYNGRQANAHTGENGPHGLQRDGVAREGHQQGIVTRLCVFDADDLRQSISLNNACRWISAHIFELPVTHDMPADDQKPRPTKNRALQFKTMTLRGRAASRIAPGQSSDAGGYGVPRDWYNSKCSPMHVVSRRGPFCNAGAAQGSCNGCK